MIVSDVSQPQVDSVTVAVKDFNEWIDLIPIVSKSDGGYSLYLDIQRGDIAETVLDTRVFLKNWFRHLKVDCDSNPRDFI